MVSTKAQRQNNVEMFARQFWSSDRQKHEVDIARVISCDFYITNSKLIENNKTKQQWNGIKKQQSIWSKLMLSQGSFI